jgi:hypothetical protein
MERSAGPIRPNHALQELGISPTETIMVTGSGWIFWKYLVF